MVFNMNLRPAQTAKSLPVSHRLRPCEEHASANLQAVRERSETAGETTSNIHTARFSVMGRDANCNLCHDSLPVLQPLPFVLGFLVIQASMTPPSPSCECVCVHHICVFHKEHTDVGVAVKWPNKASEKIPSESNQSPSVPTTKPLPGYTTALSCPSTLKALAAHNCMPSLLYQSGCN